MLDKRWFGDLGAAFRLNCYDKVTWGQWEDTIWHFVILHCVWPCYVTTNDSSKKYFFCIFLFCFNRHYKPSVIHHIHHIKSFLTPFKVLRKKCYYQLCRFTAGELHFLSVLGSLLVLRHPSTVQKDSGQVNAESWTGNRCECKYSINWWLVA